MGKYNVLTVWSALVAVTSFLTIMEAKQAPSLRQFTAGALFNDPVALLETQWGRVPYVYVEGWQSLDGTLQFYFSGMPTSGEGDSSTMEGTGAEESTGIEEGPGPDCISRGWKYGEVAFSVVDASNETECQQQCQNSSSCEVFAFDTSQNKCELHLAIGESKLHRDNSFISGPRYCGQCHEMNTDYEGEVLQQAASRVTSADQCQLRCQATLKCEYWSFSGEGCKLLASAQSKSSTEHVSGPKYCEGSCDILKHHSPRKEIGYTAKVVNMSLKECREACRTTKRCTTFTSWENGDCYLKESVTLRSLEFRALATTGIPSCSTCFRQGVAYAANSSSLLWSLPSENAEECRERCDLMERCTLFTYNAQSKTCSMLSGDVGEEQGENLVSGPARCNTNVSCFLKDVRFDGGESISETQAAGPAECQALCASDVQCNFFSFDGAACHLKGGESAITSSHAEGWVSGNKKCATTEDLCYENKMNYPSADLPQGKVKASSPEDCRAACYKEPACRLWTYEWQNDVCRLKTIDAFLGRTKASYMMSGGRMGCSRCLREGIAYTGRRIELLTDLPSETQCQLLCEAVSDCEFFTFFSDGTNKRCELMESMGSAADADMRTTMSGPKRC